MVKVLGITSLVCGSMFHLKDSLHIFMNDFDNVSKTDFLNECRRVHNENDIDIYALESSKGKYHMVSFDVLKWRDVQSLQASLRLETDFPLINMRYGITMESASRLDYKCFLTLRIGKKLLKPSPTFLTRFCDRNNYYKSARHYGIYMLFIRNMPIYPVWYKEKFIYNNPLITIYDTEHNLGESKK